MKLPKNLISEFVKITSNSTKSKSETTVYGSIVKNGESTYVKLDGSDILTPVSTTADTQQGERVTVLIKNHTATVTGNITSPAARTDDVQQLDVQKLDASEAEITYATISNLNATNVKVEDIEAAHGTFAQLTSENFNAVNASIDDLRSAHASFEALTTEKFDAVDAKIDNLEVGDLSAEYANIDFSNIGKAAMEYFYSNSGLIENVVVSDGTITGNLVGVTIKGDLIEGNTVVADKLVIKGQNGLYYKLNTDGIKTEAEQTEYNSINGSIILAKSITATKIDVDDLVAFDATIGGFNITADSLYSGVKESVNNTTKGIYLDKNGQIAIGDSNNFLKYYSDSEGNYKLDISLAGSDLKTSVDEAGKTATDFLSYDSTNGLQVGNKTGGSWSGFRTQTTSSSFNILNAVGDVLASYGAKLIELGKSAADAVIKLYGGRGRIEYLTDSDSGDSYLQISSDKLRIKSDGLTSLYSSTVNSSGEVEKSAVNVSPNEVYIYSSSSSITATPSELSLTALDSLKISANKITDSYGKIISCIEGSSGVWRYRKWSSGTVELWGSQSVSGVPCNAAFGESLYRSDAVPSIQFPFTVYSPILTSSFEGDGYGAFLWSTSATTETSPPSYYLIRTSSGTINNGTIQFHVVGTWIEDGWPQDNVIRDIVINDTHSTYIGDDEPNYNSVLWFDTSVDNQ